MRDHRLVRGDEALARIERRAGERQGRPVGPADQFEHNIDVAALRHRLHVIDPGIGGEVDPAIARAVARVDRDDLERAPGPPLDRRTVGFEEFDDTGSDGAEPGKGDAKRFGHARPPSAGRCTDGTSLSWPR